MMGDHAEMLHEAIEAAEREVRPSLSTRVEEGGWAPKLTLRLLH
jgi:hypothetical protein